MSCFSGAVPDDRVQILPSVSLHLIGALSRTIVAQFVTQALRVVGIGCAVGLVLALGFGRALAGLLYGVSPFDPLTLAGVAALVVGVAALAAFLPSLRASRIDPMEALREE